MPPKVMRCYYEVLELERKATSDEIRAAYKKKSLVYHPDRNYGNQEEAATKFKEVQNAYSILSDPNERAWYDSHREAILRGDDGGDTNPDEINLFEYFTAACYDGFGDDDGGFFAVYRTVFDTLIDEEAEYESRAKSWPRFGDSTTPWEDVQKFYTHWRHFSSVKTFAWKDEYKVSEMEDRFSRRAAGRINTKQRTAAKKEYTQTVQNLANFVHRRDPRVKEALEKQQKLDEEKRLQKEKEEDERARRRREANEKVWAEAAEREQKEYEERMARGDFMDGTNMEMLYEHERQAREKLKGAGFAMLDDDDEDKGASKAGGTQKLSCPACKKSFKVPTQYTEHINSNKHKTKLKQLAAKGTDVDALMGLKDPQEGEEEN